MRLAAIPNKLSAQTDFCKAVLHGAGALSRPQLRTLADKLHEMARARRLPRPQGQQQRSLQQDDTTVWL